MLLIHLKLDYPCTAFAAGPLAYFKESNFYLTEGTNFMNKTDLIDAIASAAELNKKQAKAALEATLEAITASLKKR